MSQAGTPRLERRARQRAASRTAILDAARVVAAREGARNLSLRGVAAEAGFAPAALYGYFAGKDELLLALAADDLSSLARAMREAGAGEGRLKSAATAALDLLRHNETFAAAQGALPAASGASDSERLFNGRLITVLKLYDIITALTGGGPAFATQSIAMYIISVGFSNDAYGYASAIAMVLLALTAIIALSVTALLRRREVDL